MKKKNVCSAHLFMLKFCQHRYFCVPCLSKYSSFLKIESSVLQCCNTLQNAKSHLCLDKFSFNRVWLSSMNLHSLGKDEGSVEYAKELCPEWYQENNPSAFISILLWLFYPPSSTRRTSFMAFSFYGKTKSSLRASLSTAGEHSAKFTQSFKPIIY